MNILIIQRQSLVAHINFSLSVYARILEAMDWLQDNTEVEYAVCVDSDTYISSMLKWADAVILSKHFTPRAQNIVQMAHSFGCTTLLDIDDWVFSFPTYSGAACNNAKRQTEIQKMLQLVDHVTVANQMILKTVKKIRSDAYLVPNGMYIEHYPAPSMQESTPLRVVFTNADFLKIHSFRYDFFRMLNDFNSRHPDVIFDYFGDVTPELSNLDFMFFTNRIPYDDFLHCLIKGQYAMAITPLGGREDHESFFFNCCKNPFKYFNYAIAGIPCIFSDVKIYRDYIENGKTGILTQNTYESWYTALETLFNDKEKRKTIRWNAYQNVAKNYHIKHSSLLFLDIIRSKNIGISNPII